MYSVRKNTREHGNTNLNMLFLNLVVTAALIWQFGTDYLVIFCSSTILILIIETGLTLSGIRKGVVYVYGRKLPRAADVLLRALVEGPAFCVPAFLRRGSIPRRGRTTAPPRADARNRRPSPRHGA